MTATGPAAGAGVVALRSAGTGLVLDLTGPGLPRVLHWGADLGALDEATLAALALAAVPPVPRSALDCPLAVPVIATELDGWSGTPGISGHRDGADHAPRFALDTVEVTGSDGAGGTVRVAASGAGLDLRLSLELDLHGVLSLGAEIRNVGDGVYDLAGLLPQLPLPARAGELLDLTGHWCGERRPQRSPLNRGTHLRECRRGRPGHDSALLLMCGTAGFGFRAGEVWGVHAAWSGNTRYLAERLPEGAGADAAVLGAGELLAPGEIRLKPGESYASPAAVFVHSLSGIDGLSERLHARLRARPAHPRTPRPVVLNTWEAVYFEHDLARLTTLADVAASVGVERFVLDDGWFGSRRHDRAGLGDWTVSEQVWPDGLGPLFDHVRGLGMQVGLWVEPEMANPDSELLRAHPDWVLTAGAPAWRSQQVLDLAREEVFAHLLGRLDALVTEYDLDFLKWDHNRDLHAASHVDAAGDRHPGVHRQTEAVYRLLDELRARHPSLEIESCASGGARVDLGIAQRTDRFWVSDTNDALDRQAIQRWTGLLLPYELMGSHIGPERTHTTNRRLELGMRGATALFGHAGIEWDLTACTPAELGLLRAWAGLYKRTRALLHTGRVVRADLDRDAAVLHGVVAPDATEALFCYVQLATPTDAIPGRVCLPGLDAGLTYRVRICDELGAPAVIEQRPPGWTDSVLELPGSVLALAGLHLPVLTPASALLLELSATG